MKNNSIESQILELGYVEGKFSRVQVVNCFACGKRYSQAILWSHIWLGCPAFGIERTATTDTMQRDLNLRDIWLTSSSYAYPEVLQLADAIVLQHARFWKRAF